DFLSAFLNKVDGMTPYQLFADLLSAAGGRKKFFARLGEEVADGLDEFLNLALSFERDQGGSLDLFIDWVTQQDPEIKRDFSSGKINAVRVITVHGAKGLQAPIVFLPDTTRVPKNLPPLLWSETEEKIPLPLWSAPRAFSNDALDTIKASYLI